MVFDDYTFGCFPAKFLITAPAKVSGLRNLKW